MTDGLAVQLAESLEAAAARKELAHFDEVASLRKELAQARADVAFLRSSDGGVLTHTIRVTQSQ